MRSHLKVKVFTLAAEMTYIRRQEEKWKNKARYARQRQHATADLTAQAKAISSQAYAENAFWAHRDHRYGLKTDARSTHLAYGCMRGISYQRMEVMCYGPLKGYSTSEPDWKHIEVMVEKFSKNETAPQDFMQAYAQWVEAAKIWYEGNTERIKAWQTQRSIDHKAKLDDPVYQQKLADNKAFMKTIHTLTPVRPD